MEFSTAYKPWTWGSTQMAEALPGCETKIMPGCVGALVFVTTGVAVLVASSVASTMPVPATIMDAPESTVIVAVVLSPVVMLPKLVEKLPLAEIVTPPNASAMSTMFVPCFKFNKLWSMLGTLFVSSKMFDDGGNRFALMIPFGPVITIS